MDLPRPPPPPPHLHPQCPKQWCRMQLHHLAMREASKSTKHVQFVMQRVPSHSNA